MRYLFFLSLFSLFFQQMTIVDFSKKTDISKWLVVVDGVMGGESTGRFFLNNDGYAQFEGSISLENNGGFSSVRYDLPAVDIENYSQIQIRLKGDGKNYQLRVKNKAQNYYSYISEFSTNGEWQTIQIALKNMFPSFRGRKLDQPNFDHDTLEEITFLIGNKKEENFCLLIDKIELK